MKSMGLRPITRSTSCADEPWKLVVAFIETLPAGPPGPEDLQINATSDSGLTAPR